jgi:hypothetical protein
VQGDRAGVEVLLQVGQAEAEQGSLAKNIFSAVPLNSSTVPFKWGV